MIWCDVHGKYETPGLPGAHNRLRTLAAAYRECEAERNAYQARLVALQEACESYLRGGEGELDTAEFMEIVFPNPKMDGKEYRGMPR